MLLERQRFSSSAAHINGAGAGTVNAIEGCMTLQEKIKYWHDKACEAEAMRGEAARHQDAEAATAWETKRLVAEECLKALCGEKT